MGGRGGETDKEEDGKRERGEGGVGLPPRLYHTARASHAPNTHAHASTIPQSSPLPHLPLTVTSRKPLPSDFPSPLP